MLSDPQSVTIDGTAHSLPRVAAGVNAGSFASNDSVVTLGVQHTYGKRTRRHIKLTHSKIAADPLQPTNNLRLSMSCGLTIDVPNDGYSVADMKKVVDGFLAKLAASSGAIITQIGGGES